MTDDFASWLWASASVGELDVDFEYLLAQDHLALGWFRTIYDDLGPIPSSRLRLLLEEAREQSSRKALEIIKREVEFHKKKMIEGQVEEGPSSSIDGRRGFYFLGRELASWTVDFSVIEIGEMVQDEIMERDWEAWPVCELHGMGLHLRVTTGQVVWWCQPGGHAVRAVYPA